MSETKLVHDSEKRCQDMPDAPPSDAWRIQEPCPPMVETAYVLIQCDLGSEAGIIKDVAGIPEVAEVRGTYGIYDIFCKIVSEQKERVDQIITAEIRRIPRIRSTITLHWIPSQGGR